MVSLSRRYNLIITVVLISIVALSLAYPLIYYSSYYREVKLVNPYLVKQQSLLLSLAYYKVMHETSLGNYSYASSILKVINKTAVVNNAEVKGLIDRFNSYINLIISQLNYTKENATLAYYYLSIGNLSYAYNLSTIALNTLKNANASTVWLSYLASTIYNSIGPYQYLSNGLKEIKESEGNLTRYILILREEIYNAKGKVKVSLYSNTTSAWLGNETKIYGNVTYLGIGIRNATVMLVFENEALNLTTNSSGYFSTNWKIPYIYKNETCIYAYFIPKYDNLSENSSSLCISLKYFKPKLNIYMNSSKVLPESYISIYGNYSLNNTYSNFNQKYIYIFINGFNSSLIKVKLMDNGTFYYKLYVPNVSNGNYTLTAVVPSHGLYYEAKASDIISVYRLFTQLEVKVPVIAITGQTITIQGNLYSEENMKNPIKNYSVIVNAFGKTYNSTSKDGRFSLKVTIPFFYTNLYSNISVKLIPNNTIYMPSSKSIKITIINPLPMVVGLAMIYGGLRYAYSLSWYKKERRRKKERSEKVEKEGYNTKREEIRKAFEIFVNNVKTFLGIDLEDSMTLREYFSLIKKAKGKEEVFDTINNLLEKEIYGNGINEEERNKLLELLAVRLND